MFDIENLRLDEKGRALYSTTIEILDGRNRPYYKEGPINNMAWAHLGGNTIPCAAHLAVPLDTPPGEYKLKVTIVDRTTNQSVVFQHVGKMRSPDFGLVRVGTFADRENKTPVTPAYGRGESLYVGFAVTGFARDKKTNQPDLNLSLRIVDEQGKATLAEPLHG